MIRPPIIIISAMSTRRVIGQGRGMPWEIPAEYQHFLDTVRDQSIIMGRTSYGIFGPDLTTRHNYVLTRSSQQFAGAMTAHSLEAAIELAARQQQMIFIGGGASVYQQALEHADRMYLSYIPGDFQGDSFFPEFDEQLWEVVIREDRGPYEFVEYRRSR